MDLLLQAVATTGRRLGRTIERSRDVLAEAERIGRSARAGRLQSRAHLRYALVVGEVDGHDVRGLVRRDGSVDGDGPLLRRAAVVEALGDAFDDDRIDATVAGAPVAVTLTLMRACDRIHHVDLAGTGPGRPPTAERQRP